jgi:capsular exopolysaccharide synthesis family protein
MSNLYEALTRGRERLQDLGLEALWEPEWAPGEGPRTTSAAEPRQNVPVIAAPDPLFPAVETSADRPKPETTALNVDLWTNIRTLPIRVQASSPVLPFDGTDWCAGEQYRILRTRIVQHAKQPRVIVVTSAGSGDGKTVTVINLAAALALKTGSRVLLLDGDFRRSRVSLELGLPSAPGLADVLKGDRSSDEALIQIEQIPNLYVMPAGEPQLNPAELLDSGQWTTMCAMWRRQFEYTVIDSPPIGAVADYDLLQAVSDGVLMVARPDHTNRKVCFKALETIPSDKMIGVVLNCLRGWLVDKESAPYYSYYRSTGQ